VGTAFTLAQAFALLAQDVRLASGGTRADLGFTTNPRRRPTCSASPTRC
jgi:hypothetical protein